MTHLLHEGSQAPDFDLPAIRGERVRLADFKGGPVVLYFYPKDDTSGCTKQAIGFSQMKSAFDALGATIIGISADSPDSHEKFKEKHALDVILASDEDKKILEAYGVWAEKSMYGKKYMGIERTTFLIDADGGIVRIWRKVKIPGHVEETLAAVAALTAD